MTKLTSEHFRAEHFRTLAQAKEFAARKRGREPRISKAKTGYIVIYNK